MIKGAKVKETCCCGSVFEIEVDYAPLISDRWKHWQTKHEKCTKEAQ